MNSRGGASGGKAKWALIHRVPIFGHSGTMSRKGNTTVTGWRPYTQWVKVGSPKWNRIMKAASQSNVHIVPTKYKNSNVRPVAPSSPPGTTISDRLPKRAPNGNPVADAPGKGSKSPGIGVPVKGSGRPKAGKAGGGRTGGSRGGSGGAGFQAIGRKIGNPNVGRMLNAKQLSKQLAALQFAPSINQTQEGIAQQHLQGAQDLQDIHDWYGQAIQMQNAAATANQAATQQAASANQAAATAILNAIGGGANAGAGQVGATGVMGVANANAIGQINQAYHANMVPALQTQLAGASAAQNALNSQANTKLQDTLNTLLQQRGAARSQAMLNIIGQNNALSQQRFANKLSKLQAQDALIQLMGNQAVQRSEIAGNRAKTRAINTQIKQSGSGGVHPKFSSLGPGDQLKLLQAWAINPANQLRSYKQALGLANAQGYTSQFAHNALLKYITGAAPTK